MKRSRHVSVALLGAAAFTLMACQQEDQTDASAFPDVQSCMAAAAKDGWFSKEDCQATFAEAQKLHAETAPRYESKELCEQEHGAGNCGGEEVAGGGEQAASTGGGMGGIFLPMMAGYLIGNMLGGGRPAAQPLVGKPGGGYATPSGGTTMSSNTGSGKMSNQAFAKAPSTVGKPPMSQAQVSSRGGFGSAAAGRAATSSAGG